MALKIGDNFSYQGQKPNFDRDSFDTLAAMKAYPETSIDEGHISYCKENGKNYQYKAANSVDSTTGKWREFKSGDSYPTGGTDGQVLTKTSSGVVWKNIPEGESELPDGGSVGQVLKKTPTGVAWQADNDTKYSKATSTTLGLIKTGYTATDKNYPVVVDENGNAYVVVPWTDTKYTLPIASNTVLGGVKVSELLFTTNVTTLPDEQIGMLAAIRKNGQGVLAAPIPLFCISEASATSKGLMSSADKTKIDSIVAMTVISQAEYDELENKDANIIYVIKG